MISHPKAARAPTLAQIRVAARCLAEHLDPTPLLPLGDWLAKAEHLQPTGSFKVRGALVALSHLTECGAGRRVVSASAGNHGRGLAHAGQLMGIEVTVVVPPECPAVKRRAIEASCRVIVNDERGYNAAEDRAKALAESEGAVYVSPYDDTWVMAGNGGALGLELLDQCRDLATVVVPVGGGGLLSGLLSAMTALAPHVRVVGVQSEASTAFAASLQGERWHETWPPARSLAEGLEGGTGWRGVQLARDYGVRALTVSEADIAAAMISLADRFGRPVEGSGAVVEAARVSGLLADCPTPVVAVITGGNVDPATVELLRREGGSGD